MNTKMKKLLTGVASLLLVVALIVVAPISRIVYGIYDANRTNEILAQLEAEEKGDGEVAVNDFHKQAYFSTAQETDGDKTVEKIDLLVLTSDSGYELTYYERTVAGGSSYTSEYFHMTGAYTRAGNMLTLETGIGVLSQNPGGTGFTHYNAQYLTAEEAGGDKLRDEIYAMKYDSKEVALMSDGTFVVGGQSDAKDELPAPEGRRVYTSSVLQGRVTYKTLVTLDDGTYFLYSHATNSNNAEQTTGSLFGYGKYAIKDTDKGIVPDESVPDQTYDIVSGEVGLGYMYANNNGSHMQFDLQSGSGFSQWLATSFNASSPTFYVTESGFTVKVGALKTVVEPWGMYIPSTDSQQTQKPEGPANEGVKLEIASSMEGKPFVLEFKPDGTLVTGWTNYEQTMLEGKWSIADGALVLEMNYESAIAATADGMGEDITLTIENAHLWDGIVDPYLYTCQALLVVNGGDADMISTRFGVRSFHVDPQKGFFLNGRSYPLRGVCRHQDWKGIGNALHKEHHDTDMAIIREMGANTLRLAHYQHDQYFYDLCDEAGLIVWAEIPYISEHLPNGRENSISQMKELVIQNYNHPSICVWGISNEITISTKDKADMMDNHRVLNDLVHELDPDRLTTLACYSVCGPFNPVAHKVSDLVSWNLYLGWYVPGMFLNELWADFFHKVYPNRCLGYSEYGCECMPQLHTDHPKRLDQSEEYQCKYHEHMLRFFDKRPWLWATHLWNTFDFAADARNQGGEPGMNHKGIVTFDRKTKKDAFYLYKAWWSDEPFVYIAGRRFVDRPEEKSTITVYTNQPEVTLYVGGKEFEKQTGDKVFRFRISVEGDMKIKAKAGKLTDEISIRRVDTPNPAYKLGKDAGNAGDWV